jgi:DNA-binding SARP family transcriptional activator
MQEAGLEYRVLGPLEVVGDDGPLALGGAKQRALLALLVLNANRVVSRERLVDALWGDDPPETAVTSIQVYVSRWRKVLPPDTLVTRAPGYLLAAKPEQIDLFRFESLVAEARGATPQRAATLLRGALALWRGPALGGLALESSARTESDRLEDLRLAALEERIEADLALGRQAELVGELQTLIGDNPHRERLRAQLMLALYRSGRQAEALDAYRAAREALVDELGLDPSAELRELEQRILSQDASLAPPRPLLGEHIALPAPLRASSPFPFVGRRKELDALRALLARVEQGEGGQVALIGGEAGSGKTRLARELAHEAAEHGTLVLYGAANADVNVPYQQFVEALEFLAQVSEPAAFEELIGGDRDDLARLLPGVGSSPVPLAGDAETARRRLHAAVSALFVRVSREHPLLIVVDDIHWTDVPSAQLLRHLARTVPAGRIFLVVTYRDRSEAVRPELMAALADLSRFEGVARVRLGGLSDDDIGAFVEQSAGATASAELAATLGELTDGTPFLLCELWRALVDTDALDSSGAGVRLTRPPAELSSPESVRDVVRYRLSRLAPRTTAVLEVAAVAGPDFELSLLGDEGPVFAAAEEAVASGMIEAVSDTGVAYRFTHELVRRALYDRLTSVRRAELHLRVGEALERHYGVNLDRLLADLARHFTLASSVAGVDRAIHYNIRAASAAAQALAYDEAARMLSTALELGIDDATVRARAELELGAALVYSGRLDQAESTLTSAVLDSDQAGAHGLRAYASIQRHHVRLRAGPSTTARETRDVARDAIDTFTALGDSGGLAQAWRLMSHVDIQKCRWEAALDALEISLDHAQKTADRRECPTTVSWLLSALYYHPTPAPVAIRRYDELLSLCGDDVLIDAIAASRRSGLLAMCGRFDEARAEGRRGLVVLDELGLTVTAGYARAYVAEAELLAGDPAAAKQVLATAYELLDRSGDHAGAVSIAYELASALCAQGRYADASGWVARADEARVSSDVMTRVARLAVAAVLAARAGSPVEARRLADESVELAAETDAPNIRAGAFVSLSVVLALAGHEHESRAAGARAIQLYESKGNVAAAVQVREGTAVSRASA